MTITRITFRNFETNLRKILKDCAKPGDTIIVEMPNQRFLVVQSLDADGLSSLVDELLATDPRFQSLVAKSKAGPRKPFSARRGKRSS